MAVVSQVMDIAHFAHEGRWPGFDVSYSAVDDVIDPSSMLLKGILVSSIAKDWSYRTIMAETWFSLQITDNIQS